MQNAGSNVRNVPNMFPTGTYGPFGYNDNNNARQHVPSNMFPPNGGLQGSSAGRFNPLSTNTMQNMMTNPSMSNFNKAFQESTPILDRPNYINQNNLLHNNLGESIIDEHIVEYRINIDSLDRDIKVYPDPFNFTVKFNPATTGYVKRDVPIDPYNKSKGTKHIEERFEGNPMPHICRDFRNVKYIRLDCIVLPQRTSVKSPDDDDDDKKPKPKSKSKQNHDRPNDFLIDDRFVVLRIKELEDDTGITIYDTGDSSMRFGPDGQIVPYHKPFGIIFPDKLLGRNYYTGTPCNALKTYKNSLLGNLRKMTIEFYDSCGMPIKVDGMCTHNDLHNAEKEGNPIPISNPCHPLNKKTQVHLSFVVGVVESQLNNNTQFAR